MPRHIAVITSPTGAAIHDFLTVFARRFPLTLISVVPTPVQGDTAPSGICAALSYANRDALLLQPPIDVVVLTRGGGSLEDLWAFNTEEVAQAIYMSTLPVVSAVGHETDITIADLVADIRAPTPSAAAALISPDREALLRVVGTVEEKLRRYITRRLKAYALQVDTLRHRLRHPANILREQTQRVDDLEQRLIRGIQGRLKQQQQSALALAAVLNASRPRRHIAAAQQGLSTLTLRLQRAIQRRLAAAGQRLVSAVQLLDAVSPMATLARGYAIVSDELGQVLRDANQAAPGSRIDARLARGRLRCRVEANAETESPQ